MPNRKYKPEAYEFSEGSGFFTRRCNKVENAVKLIYDYMYADGCAWDVVLEKFGEDFVLKESDLVEDICYVCKDCDGYMSVGDSSCCECAKELGHQKGKKTFIFYT